MSALTEQRNWKLHLQFALLKLGLRKLGFRKTAAFLKKSLAYQSTINDGLQTQEETISNVLKTFESVPKRDCLPRSLMLWWMLARRGLDSTLRLGCHKRQGFRAHAWVECKGRALGEGDEVYHNYTAFEDFELRSLDFKD